MECSWQEVAAFQIECYLWRLNVIKPECGAEFIWQILPESRLAICSPESYTEKSPSMCACNYWDTHLIFLGHFLDVKLQPIFKNSHFICPKLSKSFINLTVPLYVHLGGYMGHEFYISSLHQWMKCPSSVLPYIYSLTWFPWPNSCLKPYLHCKNVLNIDLCVLYLPL